MRIALFVAIFSLSTLLSTAAQAPASASASATTQALQLLQSALIALSPNITTGDITLSGSAHYIAGSDDETGTATLKALSTGASRVDLSLSSGPRSEVNNSSSKPPTGKWAGPDGVSHDIAFHNLLTEPAWFYPTFLVVRGLSSSGYAAIYVGHETWNGQEVEHLAISQTIPQIPNLLTPVSTSTFTHLAKTDLFLDSATVLPTAIAFNIHPDNNELLDIPIEVRFSDYRSINGTQVPFHIQKLLNNGLILDLQLRDATINSGLSATEFTVR